MALVNRYLKSLARRVWTEPAPYLVVEPTQAAISTTSWISRKPTKLSLELPNNHNILRQKFDFENHLGAEEPPQYIIQICGGKVFSTNGIVTDSKMQMLRDSFPRTTSPASFDFVKSLSKIPRAKRVEGSLAAIELAYSRNYFHWMLKILPRLLNARQQTPDWYYISSSLPYQKEVLDRLRLSCQAIEPDVWSHLVADEVVFSSIPIVAEYPTPRVVEMVRQIFTKEIEGASTGKLVYVSRADSKVRRVANESDVRNFLSSRGFEIATMSGKTVAQQAAVFASADVLVAPHGAALTNLIFCRPGTRVIEFFSPRYFNPCFWALANAAELKYSYFVGKGEVVHECFDGNKDIEVDVKVLEKTLGKIW